MLTEKQIVHAKQGMHSDGAGLYLQVTASGAKTWIYRFQIGGRRREMGLGSVKDVPAKEARIRAAQARALFVQGIDPITARDTAKLKPTGVTFEQLAREYIEAKKPEFRNEKHIAQWGNTLRDYAFPIIGHLSPADITTDHVLAVLKPIWNTKTETASRVRGRIESVLDYASVKGMSTNKNPAMWRGHLIHLLPQPSKIKPVNHHAALPHKNMKPFIKALRKRKGVSAMCLEWLVLTGCRTSNALEARWSELDLSKRSWTVAANDMKAHKEYTSPVTARMMEILERAKEFKVCDYIFPSPSMRPPKSDPNAKPAYKPMTDSALSKVHKEIWPGFTTHGFRSTITDWAAEMTEYPNEMVEIQLAHVVGSATEQAYRRTNMFEKRRQLLEDWNQYITE